MNKTENKRWQRTSPFAVIYYLGRILKGIAKNAVQSLAPLAAAVVAFEGDLKTRIGYAVAVLVSVVLAAALARYWFFRFRIGANAVLIREGVFRKTQTDIKFDRIQAINTQQNIIFRYLNLVTVTFDTAGSSGDEGRLPAVSLALAASLKERIRRERPVLLEEHEETSAPARTLLSLGTGDLIRIGLSDSRALFLLLLIGPVAERLEESVGDFIDSSSIFSSFRDLDISLWGAIGLIIGAIITLLLILLLASVLAAVLRYYRFTLTIDNDVLRSQGGLLTRHEHAVNIGKVQTLAAAQSPPLRLMRRFRLQARQASSGKASRSSKFIVPLTESAELGVISSEIFGEEFPQPDLHPASSRFQRIDSRYVRSRTVAFGVVPATIFTTLLLYPLGWYALLALLWIPLTVLFSILLYRRYGYYFDDNGLVMRNGFLGVRVIAFLHRKVQRVSIVQSVMQKRRGLANLKFYLASGSVQLPYVSLELASQLRDFVLYRIESSQRPWH